jgi:hypothetical protein
MQTWLNFITPQWEVTLDDQCLEGTAATPGVPITITLKPRDGSPPVYAQTSSYFENGGFFVCLDRPVQSGDILTRQEPTSIYSLTVPVLTARHDYARQVLTGQAPPGAPLLVYLPDNPSLPRHTWSDANGRYGLDTNGANLQLRRTGYIFYTDPDNNTIRKEFTIEGFRFWLPWLGR